MQAESSSTHLLESLKRCLQALQVLHGANQHLDTPARHVLVQHHVGSLTAEAAAAAVVLCAC
jgi:hypothetical protein